LTAQVPQSTNADDCLDAALLASRAMVGIAARAIADLPGELTLPQLRVLVVLHGGARSVRSLAETLAVHPSTATRLVDRLVNKRLLRRTPGVEDRREIYLSLNATGRHVVERVMVVRRRELAAVLSTLTLPDQDQLTWAFNRFALAAAEPAADSWELGWIGEP
jgi:DNA-binding MarR family transcriptional regulator